MINKTYDKVHGIVYGACGVGKKVYEYAAR